MATKKPTPKYLTDQQPEANLSAADEWLAKQLAGQPAEGKPGGDGVMRRVLGDGAVTALKGAISVPEMAVGLADLATGGRAGKLAEEIGFRPKEAQAMLDELYSDDQKAAFQRVQQGDGFMGKLVEAVKNPSVIAHAVGQSLPLMGAGGVVARGVMAAAPGVSAGMAGALGEGVAAAGSMAEGVRQETKDGLLTGEQMGLTGASGAVNTLLSLGGAALSRRFGIGDVDTLIAKGLKSGDDTLRAAAQQEARAQAQKGVVRKMIEGALTEGAIEELPQSVQEQVAQNLALNRPIEENVDYAAALGLLSGMAIGGAVAPFGGKPAATADLPPGAPVPPGPPGAPPVVPPAGAPPAVPPAGTPPETPPAGPTGPDIPAMQARLAELERASGGVPATTVDGPEGTKVQVPGIPGRYFSEAERTEYQDLKAKLAQAQMPPVVQPAGLSPETAAMQARLAELEQFGASAPPATGVPRVQVPGMPGLYLPEAERAEYLDLKAKLAQAQMPPAVAPPAPGDMARDAKLPNTGPMSRAVNAGLDAAAQNLDNGAPPPAGMQGQPVTPSADIINTPLGQRMMVLQRQIADPAARQQVFDALGEQGLNELFYYANKAQQAKDIPLRTRSNLLAVAEALFDRSLQAQQGPVARALPAPPSVGAPRLEGAPLPRLGLNTQRTGRVLDDNGQLRPETARDVAQQGQPAQDRQSAAVQAESDAMTRAKDQDRKAGMGLTPDVEAAGEIYTNPDGTSTFKSRKAAEIVARRINGKVAPTADGQFIILRPSNGQPASNVRPGDPDAGAVPGGESLGEGQSQPAGDEVDAQPPVDGDSTGVPADGAGRGDGDDALTPPGDKPEGGSGGGTITGGTDAPNEPTGDAPTDPKPPEGGNTPPTDGPETPTGPGTPTGGDTPGPTGDGKDGQDGEQDGGETTKPKPPKPPKPPEDENKRRVVELRKRQRILESLLRCVG